ncbi:MAG: tannase/feruloyl esterase family alpha/beta hydrolase [Limisphaerales bacterium]
MKRNLLVGLVTLCAVSALGQPTNRLSLEGLRHLGLPDVVLESVTPVAPDRKKKPQAVAYVAVKGVIGGNIRFELLLPDAWNGRFVMGGGGGFVGTVQNAARDSVNRGYATVGTDTGHEWQPGYMAGWALNNLEAQLDFGYLAVHRTAEVAKALIRAYYRADLKYGYFIGCSRGGGQAMMESQRYPNDFDGIVAGAPAFDWTGFAATMVKIAQALYPNPKHLDRAVLTEEAIQKLANGILQQGDAQDGLQDGIIADPTAVHFDLSQVAGLTDEQRQAIEAIYQGARNDHGPIYPGYTRGAECDPGQWIAWLTGPVPALLPKDHVPDLTFAFGTQVFKYLVFNNPDWDYSTYDFANFERDTRLAASFLNATNPNLDSFKTRKGKLIIWHGWADPALPAQATVDYYRRVQAHDANAGDYCRLFMIPGCLHCGGGPGATDVDWLAAIADWVEHGQAPDRLIASRSGDGKIAMTRPLYPFPEHAVYQGSGDPHRAESFVPKSPAGAAR